MEPIKRPGLYGDTAILEDPEFLHIEPMDKRAGSFEGRVDPHSHPGMLQLMFALQGDCRLDIENERHALSGPCALYIPGGTVHAFTFGGDSQGWVITASEQLFSGEGNPRFPASVSALIRAPLVHRFDQGSPVAAQIEWLCQQMHEEFHNSLTGRKAALEYLLKLTLVYLNREVTADASATVIESDQQTHFYRFKKRLEQHFRESLTATDYASWLGLTASRLNRICQQFTGKTAHGLIQERLLLEARRLLIYTAASANQIALDLGFRDPAYFNRFFKKNTGLTPIEFRRLHQRDENDQTR